MDTETDDGETDGETTAGTEDDEDTDCRITALKASYEDVCHSKCSDENWNLLIKVTFLLMFSAIFNLLQLNGCLMDCRAGWMGHCTDHYSDSIIKLI